MKKSILLITYILFLVGCASTDEMKMAYDAQVKVVESQTKIVDKPTLSIACGSEANSCQGLSVQYLDPRDRNRVQVPTITNTNDVVKSVVPSVVKFGSTLVTKGAETLIMRSAFDSAGGNNFETHNTTSVVGDNNTTTASTTATRTNHNGATDNSNSSDNSDNSDNSIVDSHDSYDRHDYVDSHDQVAEPTVVDPVVVNPEVVNPVVVDPKVITQ